MAPGAGLAHDPVPPGYSIEWLTCAFASRLHLGDVTANPTGEWTMRQARNLDERFEDTKLLLRDRGSNFISSFDAVFQATGTRILRTAVQAPHMNAICERLVGTPAPGSWTGCRSSASGICAPS
jgi:hypothetical protein